MSEKNRKIPVKCPLCGTIFTVSTEELKDIMVCPKCKMPLELRVFPVIRSPQDVYYLSLVATLQNINKLYDVLVEKLKKVIE